MMQDDQHLTVKECEELSRAMRQDASVLPNGLQKENLLKLAIAYCNLAQIKRQVLRKTN